MEDTCIRKTQTPSTNESQGKFLVAIGVVPSSSTLLLGSYAADEVRRETSCADFTSRYDIDNDSEFMDGVNALAEMKGRSISLGDAATISTNCESAPGQAVGEALDQG